MGSNSHILRLGRRTSTWQHGASTRQWEPGWAASTASLTRTSRTWNRLDPRAEKTISDGASVCDESMPTPDLNNWSPLSADDVGLLFADFNHRPWWMAGGLAIDAFLGYKSRRHDDTDVGVLRRDQSELKRYLERFDWELWVADPPGELRLWRGEDLIPPDVHEVWCRLGADATWSLEVLLEDSRMEHWLYRRDHRLTLPLDAMVMEWGKVAVPLGRSSVAIQGRLEQRGSNQR